MPGNLRLAVMLPEGEDINEWVAVNTVDFFNQVPAEANLKVGQAHWYRVTG